MAESAGADIRLGPIRVSTDPDSVARYRREIGFDESCGNVAPAAYPIVWLSCAEIAAAIREELRGGEEALPVHESQSFRYFEPLRVGEAYDLTVLMRRESEPARIVLNATVTTLSGEARAHSETVLRIVSRAASTGGTP
jgi:hypothetical protein